MKTSLRFPLRPALLAAVLATGIGFDARLHAQSFDTGSNGSLGDVVIATDTVVTLPEDGVLHYKSLQVASGARMRFARNARNTPVHILSQGDVVVNGIIDVNGSPGGSNVGGTAGPGGFDGGKPGFGGDVPPGSGYGPGAGRGGDGGCNGSTSAGGGAFGQTPGYATAGTTYGNTILIPLVGGSGGGGGAGQPGNGGGGGAGAILIAANTTITINGQVQAIGGGNRTCLNGGSGGGIRIVAPKVAGSGQIDVRDGGNAGLGRIRVDTIDRTGIAFSFLHPSVTTVGANLLAFPPSVPKLRITEAAGNNINSPESGPVTFTLPFGSSPNRTIKIQARDFGRNVPIRVTLTPDSGSPTTFDAEVDNSSTNPATVDVPVTVPVNTLVTVHCWTR